MSSSPRPLDLGFGFTDPIIHDFTANNPDQFLSFSSSEIVENSFEGEHTFSTIASGTVSSSSDRTYSSSNFTPAASEGNQTPKHGAESEMESPLSKRLRGCTERLAQLASCHSVTAALVLSTLEAEIHRAETLNAKIDACRNLSIPENCFTLFANKEKDPRRASFWWAYGHNWPALSEEFQIDGLADIASSIFFAKPEELPKLLDQAFNTTVRTLVIHKSYPSQARRTFCRLLMAPVSALFQATATATATTTTTTTAAVKDSSSSSFLLDVAYFNANVIAHRLTREAIHAKITVLETSGLLNDGGLRVFDFIVAPEQPLTPLQILCLPLL